MATIFFIAIFILLVSVSGSPIFTPEEVNNNIEGGLEIINGDNTTIKKFPIDVSFLISNNIWGAGVIVDAKWILTTAFNCLWVDASYITIRLGSDFWNQGGQIIPAETCVMHPNYTGTWANNIALVKLAGTFKFGPSSRQGFYNPDTTYKIPNTTYDVSGWGVSSASYAKVTQLKTIPQTILDDEECAKFYDLSAASGSFCASNPKGGPCVFDFGAPMNRKRYAVGLYQGSIDCTQPQTYPDLYVDVFQYKDWIASIINGL